MSEGILTLRQQFENKLCRMYPHDPGRLHRYQEDDPDGIPVPEWASVGDYSLETTQVLWLGYCMRNDELQPLLKDSLEFVTSFNDYGTRQSMGSAWCLTTDVLITSLEEQIEEGTPEAR
ncbi:hypothetical protein [Burkholderia phage BCSR5]|nr:hypothetical protein [Burkholderia phage BCSR5]